MHLFISHDIDGRNPRPLDLTCTADLRVLFDATAKAVYDTRPEDAETDLAIEAWAADNRNLACLPEFLDEWFLRRIRDELAEDAEPGWREHALSASQLGVKTGRDR